MYSAKIKEEYIPPLYRLAKNKRQRMTAIVKEAIRQYPEREARKEATPSQ